MKQTSKNPEAFRARRIAMFNAKHEGTNTFKGGVKMVYRSGVWTRAK